MNEKDCLVEIIQTDWLEKNEKKSSQAQTKALAKHK